MSPFVATASLMLLINFALALRYSSHRARARGLRSELAALRSARQLSSAGLEPAARQEDRRDVQYYCNQLSSRFDQNGAPFAVVLLEVTHREDQGAPLSPELTAYAAEAILDAAAVEDAVFEMDDRTFVVLQANADAQAATRFADRARAYLAPSPVWPGTDAASLTMSAGIVQWRRNIASLEAATHEARKQIEFVRRSVARHQASSSAHWRTAA